MTKAEDISKAVQDGVAEVFANAGKAKLQFRGMKPWTPEERAKHEEETRIMYEQSLENKRIYKLTHKYNDWIMISCPKCGREFDGYDLDDGAYEVKQHVEDCIKDCTGCDSFDSEERCAHCYTYSLWVERDEDVN